MIGRLRGLVPGRTAPAGKSRSSAARIPAGMRAYAIGDVHGRADLLRRKFDAIDTDAARHPGARAVEILLGDYVDRGPASREVVDLVLARRAERSVVTLRGNHEQMLLDVLRDPNQLLRWAPNGGLETLTSYGLRPPRRMREEDLEAVASELAAVIPEAHVEFLRGLGDFYELGDYLFVHAGLRPGIALLEQDSRDLLWIREEFLQSQADFGRLVVHGHSPVMAPEFKPNRINIDTGAYITGNLTCLVLEGDATSLI